MVLTLPSTPGTLVLRADFTDDAAWATVQAVSREPSPDGFLADLWFVSDRAFADLTVTQVAATPYPAQHTFLFLVDHSTVRDPEMSLVVVDLYREPGRWFRVVPAKLWSVENNLSLANMDFHDFADNVAPDGVFRGFPT
ncbi:hypothetical protein [Pseudofrankia sp. DC12]|uniref:DUF6924 domain-containing protein n=1 Tax=Pseudofrankia sp. DC12 TaxID=683315 RepID=UPI0005F8275A|nr:hypothetical protein [Pseudofrankia sp. DC12]